MVDVTNRTFGLMYWCMEPIGLPPISLHITATGAGIVSIGFVIWSVITDSGVWLASGLWAVHLLLLPASFGWGKSSRSCSIANHLLCNCVGEWYSSDAKIMAGVRRIRYGPCLGCCNDYVERRSWNRSHAGYSNSLINTTRYRNLSQSNL